MEMYNIDFRRDEQLAEDANAANDTQPSDQEEYKPGSIPFDETDAGKNGGKPFWQYYSTTYLKYSFPQFNCCKVTKNIRENQVI